MSSDGVERALQRIADQPEQWLAAVSSLRTPAARQALALRVLQRAALQPPAAALFAWSAEVALAHGDADAMPVVAEAFARLEASTWRDAVARVAEPIDDSDHPNVAVLLACVDAPQPPAGDRAATEAALAALAPYAHEAPVLLPLLASLEGRAPGPAVVAIVNALFDPAATETCVIGKLSDDFAKRVARALVACAVGHPDATARAAAARLAPEA